MWRGKWSIVCHSQEFEELSLSRSLYAVRSWLPLSQSEILKTHPLSSVQSLKDPIFDIRELDGQKKNSYFKWITCSHYTITRLISCLLGQDIVLLGVRVSCFTICCQSESLLTGDVWDWWMHLCAVDCQIHPGVLYIHLQISIQQLQTPRASHGG